MAKKIEPTPTLYGKDAENFINSINSATYSESKEQFLKESTNAYLKYVKKK